MAENNERKTNGRVDTLERKPHRIHPDISSCQSNGNDKCRRPVETRNHKIEWNVNVDYSFHPSNEHSAFLEWFVLINCVDCRVLQRINMLRSECLNSITAHRHSWQCGRSAHLPTSTGVRCSHRECACARFMAKLEWNNCTIINSYTIFTRSVNFSSCVWFGKCFE